MEFEAVFIDNLVRHAKEGVILSWARIGQLGHSHINNRDLSYVIERLKERNFIYDEKMSLELRNGASFHWLKNNVNAYRRAN